MRYGSNYRESSFRGMENRGYGASSPGYGDRFGGRFEEPGFRGGGMERGFRGGMRYDREMGMRGGRRVELEPNRRVTLEGRGHHRGEMRGGERGWGDRLRAGWNEMESGFERGARRMMGHDRSRRYDRGW